MMKKIMMPNLRKNVMEAKKRGKQAPVVEMALLGQGGFPASSASSVQREEGERYITTVNSGEHVVEGRGRTR